MTTITIQCPDEVLVSLKEDAESFGRDLTLTAAMKFYELGRLSSGRAAELAGLSRVEFLNRAAAFRVPAWDLTAEELREDLRHAGHIPRAVHTQLRRGVTLEGLRDVAAGDEEPQLAGVPKSSGRTGKS